MTKTPEQMAEDKAYELGSNNIEFGVAKDAFLAGYQAGKEAMINIQSRMDGAIDRMFQRATGNSSNNSNGWISVKERLPEVFKVYDFYRDSNCVLITVAKKSDQQTSVNPYVTVAHLAQFKSEEPMWTACRCSVSGNEVKPNEWKLDQVIYWMPLPKPPEK